MSINMNLEARFENENGEYLCFRHAILAVVEGEKIEMDIDSHNGGCDMRLWACKKCWPDRENKK